MFRAFIGRGKMSTGDLETRINDWKDENNQWENDTVDHELSERNTEIDGSGEIYYGIDVRFYQDDTKDNILQKFTDKLKDKVDWYRVGYHNCPHNEEDGGPCSWDDATEWTGKDVTIPSGVPTFDVE
jgi:hypothetical protein